ncbi:MAG: polysaccharide biosynthesis protein [Cyclobacteriaceae bacterium]
MSNLAGKTVLITGGTGTVGQGLVNFIVQQPQSLWPKRLVLLSRDEYKQFESRKRFPAHSFPFISYTLADVSDYHAILDSFALVDLVVHTAALKRVEAGELNPEAFIKTNVLGTTNVLRAAKIQHVPQLLTISTDKAVYPTTLYGATKLCAEKTTVQNNGSSQLRASVIRLGNIFGSRGSIVDDLRKSSTNSEITITHQDMTRFTTSIQEAAKYILEVTEYAIGGEIFIPKMNAYRLTDLVSVVSPDAKISFTSPRYMEKLHESLFSTEESRFTLEREYDYIISTDESVRKLYRKKFNIVSVSAPEYSSEQSAFLTNDELKELYKTQS